MEKYVTQSLSAKFLETFTEIKYLKNFKIKNKMSVWNLEV